MKTLKILSGIFFLSSILVLVSCKKENTEEVPLDATPSLIFMTGVEYVSSDTTLEVDGNFKVGVLGAKNQNSSINIATFKVVRELNGTVEVVYENNDVGKPDLSWESQETANSAIGEEKWTFTIKDYTGNMKEISFVITSVGQGAFSPSIMFIAGAGYVSENTSLYADSSFNVGITATESAETSENIQHFIVERTFNNITTTVYEEDNIDSPQYMWEEIQTANSEAGDELWTFKIEDLSGYSNTISFTITTDEIPYIPAFSPTYLVVNPGGVELLDFYITCLTDDWEMEKIVVTYPNGIGSDTFFGSGFVTQAYEPFTFAQYFPKLGGTWTFTIIGIVRSGTHNGEDFTAFATVTVTGK